jgi:predicted SnoaL-like aldol condensation-catalyzing enzyme
MRRISTSVVVATVAAVLFLTAGVCQAESKKRVADKAGARWAIEEANKKVVVAFYNEALNEKDPDEALRYIGPTYKQHNPTAEDGREGFRKFILWIKSDHPDSHSEIKQVFADGNFVILNVHMVRFPSERGLAIAEIFRLEDGKIVEHWDRIQAIPESSKNDNGMF